MVKRRLRMISAAVLAGAALTLWTPAATTAEENDLREFRLGMRADELPRTGYVGVNRQPIGTPYRHPKRTLLSDASGR